MAKSIAVLVVIALLVGIWSISAYSYVSATVEKYTQRIEKLMETPEKQGIKQINDDWENDKRHLMYIMNHRDVEQVSEALLRSEKEIFAGRVDMALQEIAVARFYLKELTEREKFSLENLL